MYIELIDDLEKFERLKATWETVYSADPHAHIFVSWPWLHGFFRAIHYYWFVLALRPDESSPYVAFLPLTFEKDRFNLVRSLRLGGTPIADYTGFVCLPECQEQAIAAFAHYVQREFAWDRLHLKDVLDPRLDLFLESFSENRFNAQQIEQIACPYITLPESWDRYLKEALSQRTRQSLRYCIRQLERLDEFHVTGVRLDNFTSQTETLLEFWRARWGQEAYGYRNIFHSCLENDSLWLDVLWQGTTPIAALAALVDRPKKTFSYIISGFNNDYSKFSPGRVVVAHSIRYAIENGFQVYDFLRGDESYKLSFGAIVRLNSYTLVTRKSLRSSLANTTINLARKLKFVASCVRY